MPAHLFTANLVFFLVQKKQVFITLVLNLLNRLLMGGKTPKTDPPERNDRNIMQSGA